MTDATGRASFTNLKAEGDVVGVRSAITFFASKIASVQQRDVTIAAGRPAKFTIGMASVVPSGSRLGGLSAVDVDGNATSVDEFMMSLPDVGTPSKTNLLWMSVASDSRLVVHGLKGTAATIRVMARKDQTKVLYTQSFTITTDAKIGDPGPSGGTIIFDGVTTNGNVSMLAVPSISGGGRFFETAAKNWNVVANQSAVNVLDSLNGNFSLSKAVTTIGAMQGGNNTKSIVAEQVGRPYAYGPKVVESLSLNGYDDWFLPSSEEFKLIIRQPEAWWRPNCGVFTKFMTSSLTGTKQTANFFDASTTPWSLKSLSVETLACIVPLRAFG